MSPKFPFGAAAIPMILEINERDPTRHIVQDVKASKKKQK